MNYIKSSIEEVKKVTWPTKNQAIKLTIITIIFTIAATALLALSDFVFKEGYQGLLNASNKVYETTPDVSTHDATSDTIDEEAIEELLEAELAPSGEEE